MKNKLKYIFLSLTLAAAGACNGFLDIVPDDIATIENAFTMRSSAKKFLFTCYSYMPQHGLIGQNPAIAGGDEITHTTAYRSSGNVHAWYIAHGAQSPTNVRSDYWRGSNGATDLYQAISDCNIFLANIHKVPDMPDAERNRWRAEVEFLKAYYHFWLIRQFGPIPIKDVNVPVDAPEEQIKAHRDPIDDCFDYVVGLLDKVIKSGDLPEYITDEAQELGRITKGIAMAVKAEVLMNAASPLFNGNTDYTGYIDNRGIEIFNPRKSEEEKLARWRQAATACEEAIEFLEGIGHGMYYYTALDYNISDVTRTKMSIRMAMTDRWNKEVIWGNSNSRVGALQQNAIPRGLEPGKEANGSAAGNLAVPLKIAAQFYTKNGVPITEDVTWDYDSRFDIKTVGADHENLLQIGYKTAAFNFDREPRYYASLGFDGCIWFGQGKTQEGSLIYVQCKQGQSAGNFASATWNDTGIWPKKLVHFQTTVATTSGVTQIQYSWPVLKMSGLYLWYAEALNEIGTSWENVVPWIDIVRERSDLKGVEYSWTNFSSRPEAFKSQGGLREIIHRERNIETAFEAQRFWDLRRWKKAYEELNKPITGWNTAYSDEEEYYVETPFFYQTFSIKEYFWPIANTEIYANSNTVQNFGW